MRGNLRRNREIKPSIEVKRLPKIVSIECCWLDEQLHA